MIKTSANRLLLNYEQEASTFRQLPYQIIDVHSHIVGGKAATIYKEVAAHYGIGCTYTMTPFSKVADVQAVLGDRIRFIATPDFHAEDKKHAFTHGFLDDLDRFAEVGARIAKFWAAPRGRDFGAMAGDPNLLLLNAPIRVQAMEKAVSLGMMLMAHIGDPSTWFSTKYADSTRYGTRRDQYAPLEELIDRFQVPWILAHMGGWPEDLEFLTELLRTHDQIYLDTSATKWMVRELSKHSREELLSFLMQWKGRILYGSDIVTSDAHVSNTLAGKEFDSPTPYDLYASRYWSQRTLFETDYEGESPIADPDLHLVDPEQYSVQDAPLLRGKSLPDDILQSIYADAVTALLGPH